MVFNATGVWADDLRRRAHDFATTLTAISRGSHITLPASFLPGSTGMMIPRTVDGRVLFAIPWHGRLILGTTDVAANGATWEPQASDAEVEFILDTARSYLQTPPSTADVLATFAGLRPLFSPRAAKATKTISREHAIVIEHQNLITVIGGKWTTYRKMALDALDQAAKAGLLDARPCVTAGLKLDVDDSLEAACRAAEDAALSVDHGHDGAIEKFVRSGRAARAGDQRRRCACASTEGRVPRSRAAARLQPLVQAALSNDRLLREARKKKPLE